MNTISISTVLFNTPQDEITSFIQILEKQQEVNIQLFIWDNSHALKSLPKSSFPIRIRNSFINKGYGYGHNRNFELSDPDHLFLVMNSDIEIDDPYFLKKLLEIAKDHEGLSSVRILNTDGSHQGVHFSLPTPITLLKRFILKVIPKHKQISTMTKLSPCISGCFMLFSPGFFKKVGGFDENIFLYFEDIDLSRRAHELSGMRNTIFTDLSIKHQWQRKSYKNIESFKRHVISAFYYFSKYGFFFDHFRDQANKEAEKQ